MYEEITYDELHKRFLYIPNFGIIWDKENSVIAGTINSHGYLIISINGKNYPAHRIAYCMHYGYFPKCILDHINRNKTDNRIENLREASASCNARNRKLSVRNNSGVSGVSWSMVDQIWKATIGVDNKNVFIGQFKFFFNAVRARHYAERLFYYFEADANSTSMEYIREKDCSDMSQEDKDAIFRDWRYFYFQGRKRLKKLAKKYHESLT